MKIYDAFTFFNELDLLDIRLNVMNDIVDQFVLVEATKTFQNRVKPLFFENNKYRYSKFLHKITHIIVDDMPDSDDTRLLEAHQRNAIERGLMQCKPDDKILLSDLDEIPDPSKVKFAEKISGIRAFRQRLYYYYLNCACRELSDLPWTIMADFKDFRPPQVMRQYLMTAQAALLSGSTDINVTLIEDGGWHFSYLGGIEAILGKLEAFADPEYNKKVYQDADRISHAISQGLDLFGRNLNFYRVPVDEHFPSFIRVNLHRFEHLIHE